MTISPVAVARCPARRSRRARTGSGKALDPAGAYSGTGAIGTDLGGKFVEVDLGETGETKDGYAKSTGKVTDAEGNLFMELTWKETRRKKAVEKKAE